MSSGQELVTTTADYLEFVLDETDATLIGLVLETVRDGPRVIAQLQRAAARDIPGSCCRSAAHRPARRW